MSDLNKYYDSILKKADEYSKENKLLEVIQLLEDELDAPYIPEEYIKIFEEKLIEAKYKYNYDNPKNPLSTLSKFELIDHINKNNDDCDLAIISYFERFFDEFDSIDYEFIKKIFMSDKFENSSKITLIKCLKVRGVDLDFTFVNKNTGLSKKINLSNLKIIDEDIKLNEIAQSIKELVSSEPSLLDICYASLYSIYEYYFPEFPFEGESSIEIAKKIIYVIKCIIESKDMENDESTNLIFNVLKSK